MTNLYIRRRIFNKLRLYNDHLYYFNQKSLKGYSIILLLYAVTVIIFLMDKFQLLKKTEILPSTFDMVIFTVFSLFICYRVWKIKKYGLDLPKADEMQRLNDNIDMYVKGVNWRYKRQRRVVRIFSFIQLDQFVFIPIGLLLVQIFRSKINFNIETILPIAVIFAVVLGNLTSLRITNSTFEDYQRKSHIKIRNIVVTFLIQSRLNPRNK